MVQAFSNFATSTGRMLRIFVLMLSIYDCYSSFAMKMVAEFRPRTQANKNIGAVYNAPSISLSAAFTKGTNGVYVAREPEDIPTGFVRMCGKAGGFAPRPLWETLTNGVTPWFESGGGSFIYLNCQEGNWWIDDSTGSGMYLAAPRESLLLPPTSGWTTLTGRRMGVPKIAFC